MVIMITPFVFRKQVYHVIASQKLVNLPCADEYIILYINERERERDYKREEIHHLFINCNQKIETKTDKLVWLQLEVK